MVESQPFPTKQGCCFTRKIRGWIKRDREKRVPRLLRTGPNKSARLRRRCEGQTAPPWTVNSWVSSKKSPLVPPTFGPLFLLPVSSLLSLRDTRQPWRPRCRRNSPASLENTGPWPEFREIITDLYLWILYATFNIHRGSRAFHSGEPRRGA